MKKIPILLAAALFIANVHAAWASSESTFEEQAYREIAHFLKVEAVIVRDQQKLAAKMAQLIPIGTIKPEALAKLRTSLENPPQTIRLEWELERNPGGVSVVFVKGKRGFGITVVIRFDSDSRVAAISVSEFVHE